MRRKRKYNLEGELRRLGIVFEREGDLYLLDGEDWMTKAECWKYIYKIKCWRPKKRRARALAKKAQNRKIRYMDPDVRPKYKPDRWLWD